MKDFEKHIKEKFQGFEVEPPPDMWYRIELQLEQKPVGQKFIWYRVAAAVALLVIAAYSTIVYLPEWGGSSQLATEVNQPVDSLDSTIRNVPQPISGQGKLSEVVATEALENDVKNLHAARSITHSLEAVISDAIGENRVGQDEIAIAENAIPAYLPSLESQAITVTSRPLLASRSSVTGSGIIDGSQNQDLLGYHDDLIASAPDDNRSKFSISAFVGPQSSFRYQSRSAKLAYEPVESQLRSIDYGLNAHYRISPSIELQTGVTFSRLGQRIHDIAVFRGEPGDHLFTLRGQPTRRHPQSMVSSMGAILFTDQSFYYADLSSGRVFTLKGSFDESNLEVLRKTGLGLVQHFYFLQIPLMARFQLFEHRLFSLSAKAGLSANIFKSGRVLLDDPHNQDVIGNIVVVSNYNLAGSFGVILGVPVANRINLLIEPTFTMFINSLGENANISGNTHPYSNAVHVGLSYDL